MSAIKYQKVYSNNGTSSFTPGASPQVITLEVKPEPMYWNKSYIEFDVALTTTGKNTSYKQIYGHLIPWFTRFQLRNQVTGVIDELDGLHNWTSLALRPAMTMDELKTEGRGFVSETASMARPISGLVKLGESELVETRATPLFNQNAADKPYTSVRPIAAAAATGSTDDLEGIQYLINAGNNATTYMKYRIPLARYVGTFLASKDLYYAPGSNYLTLHLNSIDGLGFKSGGGTYFPGAANGAVLFSLVGGADPDPNENIIAVTLAISNFSLNIAYERNQSLVDQVKAEVASGVKNYYFSSTQRLASVAGTSSALNSVSVRLNSYNGVALKQLWTAAIDSASSLEDQYNHNNSTTALAVGGRVANYFHNLNNTRIENVNVDCTAGDDCQHMIPYLSGSALPNGECFQYNFFMFRDFSLKERPIHEALKDTSSQEGLPLDQEQKVECVITAGATASQLMMFGVFARVLQVMPDGQSKLI